MTRVPPNYIPLHPNHGDNRNETLHRMVAEEFPTLWKTAVDAALQDRQVALSMIVRLTRRVVEVGATETEKQLNNGQT